VRVECKKQCKIKLGEYIVEEVNNLNTLVRSYANMEVWRERYVRKLYKGGN